ncbi:MAG: methyl-accepting chemotaxis protein, partial [Moraxellaceae bacterium]|nr:methyl-accepting chemotaxis protein [Moraxellaceae bacterium]
TPVTVSNEENNLIYMNRSGRTLLESIFKSSKIVDSLYGKPLVESLTDEALIAITTGRLERPQMAQGMVGDRIIRLSTSPVIDQSGTYLGRVCQWVDRTAEIAAEQDVAAIVEAAAAGDFSKRIEVSNKEGYFKSLAVDLNNFVEAVDNALSDVVRVLNSLAKGDLTQTIDRDYTGTFLQMKTDANATVAQLKSIVTTISEATDAINGAAKEIASGNVDLSRRTESQAASLEQTASSTEELTNTVKNNADNASQASQLARTSSEVADRGGKVVSEVVSTMGAIAESSNKIAEIISVIDGIAFQTNILALNAAVEAARAGEQGRGFAVVAGEVRNLAQRSASAAKEIKELISESVSKVSNGYKLVETAGQTMQEIVSSTQRVASIMNEISSASEEQRNGIMQLSHAITSMDESTQQNAALVEEA